jgi:uncharacterized membrane protein SirB2
MLDSLHQGVRLLHIGCVVLSGSLFTVRGVLRARDSAAAHHPALRFGSYAIDTTLLLAAIVLTAILHQYPFVNAWLTAKLGLLVLYIGFGTVALKRGRTRRIRILAFGAALVTFVLIVGVAVTRQPAGWLVWLR